MPRARIPVIVRPPRQVQYTEGPWDGVRDTPDPEGEKRKKLLRAVNLMPDASTAGRYWVTRPGSYPPFAQVTGRTYGRLVHQYTKADGTEYTVVGFDTKLYTVSTTATTEIAIAPAVINAPTTTNQTTLNATLLIHAVTFAGYLIVNPNDGVHKPFMWDGTTITVLAAAPLAYGKPTVRSGKLFFIDWTSRNTIHWSNEGDATTGYSGASPAQSWQLRQTSGEGLNCILGTNDGLYFWRNNSFDVVRGEVAEDFATSSTTPLAERVGSLSPGAIVLAGESIWFPDQFGQVQRYLIGGGLMEPEPWRDAAFLSAGMISTGDLAGASGVYLFASGQVHFLLPSLSAADSVNSVRRLRLTFGARTGQYHGNWATVRGSDFTGTGDNWSFSAHALGIVKYGSTVERAAHLTDWIKVEENHQDAYTNGTATYADMMGTARARGIFHILDAGPFGLEPRASKLFSDIEVTHGDWTITEFESVSYTTTNEVGFSTAQAVTFTGVESPGFPPFQIVRTELRKIIGIGVEARYLIVRRTYENAVPFGTFSRRYTPGPIIVTASLRARTPYGT